jgi:hypothetical protein
MVFEGAAADKKAALHEWWQLVELLRGNQA